MSDSIASKFTSASKTAIDLSNGTTDRKRVRIGIVGCGRIGRLHAATIVGRLPQAELVCVSDFFEKAALDCATTYGVPMACVDHNDLIDNANVDAVIVCSPTDTHAGIIKACAAKGKHVFCEKPIDKNVQVIRSAIKAVEDAGVKLFVGFQRRFDRNFRRALKAKEDGVVGDVVKLHLVSRDPGPPPLAYLKESGGIFLDQAIHDLDMARFLVGCDVVEVTAYGMALNKDIKSLGDYDHTLCVLKFENGVIATVDNSRSASYGYDQRGELFGTKGSVMIGNEHLNQAAVLDKVATHRDNPEPFFMERYADAYKNEMEAFVDCIVNNKPVPCGGQDGLISVIYSLAATRSMKEKRPVKIAEFEDVPKAKI